MLVGQYCDEIDGISGHAVFNGTLAEFDEAVIKVRDYHLSLWDSFWMPEIEKNLKAMALYHGFDENLLEFRDLTPPWQYLQVFTVDGSESFYGDLDCDSAIFQQVLKVFAPINELGYDHVSFAFMSTLKERYNTLMDDYMKPLGFQKDFLLEHRDLACHYSNQRQYMREMSPEEYLTFQEALRIQSHQNSFSY